MSEGVKWNQWEEKEVLFPVRVFSVVLSVNEVASKLISLKNR